MVIGEFRKYGTLLMSQIGTTELFPLRIRSLNWSASIIAVFFFVATFLSLRKQMVYSIAR